MTKLLEDYLPFFTKLSDEEKDKITKNSHRLSCPRGKILHGKNEDCLGFVLVLSGRLRVYISSDEGKEITLYRMLERDMCLFSASCTMANIQFDVMLSAEEESEVLVISPGVYKELMDTSLPVSRYTGDLMSSRLSDIMWLMDQVLNTRLDSRVAALLLEEVDYVGDLSISITQEQLANHLGTAREVVTRILRDFQHKGWISVKRGGVEIISADSLREISAPSRR